MATLSVVVPVYQSEDCLEELVARLVDALSFITTEAEIVLIDDGSTDNSWGVITRLSLAHQGVRGIKLSRNFGQHMCISAGLDHVDSDWIVVMDCDLQDRPEDIPKLYEKALEGFDIVIAHRNSRKDSFGKQLRSRVFYTILNMLSDVKYDHRAGTFMIFSRTVLVSLRSLGESSRFFPSLINWVGFRSGHVGVTRDDRYAGSSTYGIRREIRLAFDAAISHTDRPLRAGAILGLLISSCSVLYGCSVVFNKIVYGAPVVGWSSTISFLAFISGAIIFFMCIIGLYLGKVFYEAKRRPLYIVQSSTS